MSDAKKPKLVPDVTPDEIDGWWKSGMDKDRREIEELPPKFKPGEGIEDVVGD